MKAVWIESFGPEPAIVLRDVRDPSEPSSSEVTIRVHAAGLNRADLLQARGIYPPPKDYSDRMPGLEFAGEIVKLGPAVTDYSAGDRVFGITSGEAQAEYLNVDSSLLMRIPERLSYVEAAAIPEAFITAHDAMITQGELGAGETLLIHAVASGVGSAALQIGKYVGARVIDTSRKAAKLDRCKQFGLDVAISTAESDKFAEKVKDNSGGAGADVILDLVGGSYLDENLHSLASKGRLLLVGLTGGAKAELDMGVVLAKRARLIGTVLRARSTREKAEATAAFAADLLPTITAGVINPTVDLTFPINDVREAYKYLASNESFGKVILEC